MAEKGLVSKSALTAIADAIRAKNNTSATMLPGEMAALITAISTGVELPSWIEEIKFSSMRPSVDATSVTIPCSFLPTHLVAYCGEELSRNYIGLSMQTDLHDMRYVIGSTAALYIGFELSLSGGRLTIDAGSNVGKFAANKLYYFIMWR